MPLNGIKFWKKSGEATIRPPPQNDIPSKKGPTKKEKRLKGRNESPSKKGPSKKKGQNEEPPTKKTKVSREGRIPYCGRCGLHGHNIRTCNIGTGTTTANQEGETSRERGQTSKASKVRGETSKTSNCVFLTARGRAAARGRALAKERGTSTGSSASSRGRGATSRGRGPASRGRGASSRGRGAASRGRGEALTGDGEASRGRETPSEWLPLSYPCDADACTPRD